MRLIEPRPGGIYPGSLTARAQVQTPDGRPPERVELFVNDQPAATLTEPPFVHGLRLPDGAGADAASRTAASRTAEIAVVRAVAHLADGSWVDDSVVVNASPFSETIDVRLVELHPLITDSEGRPVADLDRESFRLFEDGVEQTIERFERSADTPVRAALLIDRSSSMEPHLRTVANVALSFAEAAVESPGDRVAVLSFAEDLSHDTGFTSGSVARALAGLDARGGTALYDKPGAGLEHLRRRPRVDRAGDVLGRSGREEQPDLRADPRHRPPDQRHPLRHRPRRGVPGEEGAPELRAAGDGDRRPGLLPRRSR